MGCAGQGNKTRSSQSYPGVLQGQVGDLQSRAHAQLDLITIVQAPQAPTPPIARAYDAPVQACAV